MKKIVLAFLVLGLSLSAYANNKFRIDELVLLPHPGRVLKHHAEEIGVTKQEKMRIKKEVKSVFAPKFQGKIREAFKIEKKVRRAVIKGKKPADLKKEIDEIARLKREAIDYRIQALNKIREIVGDAKWKKIVNFKLSKAQNKGDCGRK